MIKRCLHCCIINKGTFFLIMKTVLICIFLPTLYARKKIVLWWSAPPFRSPRR